MLQNVQTHTRCYCYDNKAEVVKFQELSAHDEPLAVATVAQEIIFVIKGSVHVHLRDGNMSRDLLKDEFIFMPIGCNVTYTALEDSTLIFFRVSGDVPQCHVFNMERIVQHVDKKYDGIYALSIGKRVRSFLDDFIETYTDGLRCSQFLHLQVSRLLYLIHAYHPLEECTKFFSLIISPDINFSEFVRLNHRKYPSVAEFAAAMNMSNQQFSNQFRRVFGMTPINWMRGEQAKRIYHDICRSDLSFKEISLKYNFSAQANFTRFCHKFFGSSPGDIRLSLKESMRG
ncbi:MAG: AraC family transcriptional regulator [Alistipes sp.]|jgi:AraC-like DNA-binding protein|nr:AraC family transcriptional regulator [Alistipes sp.]